MKHWKLGLLVLLSLGIIVVFQNCAVPSTQQDHLNSSSAPASPQNSADVQPESVDFK